MMYRFYLLSSLSILVLSAITEDYVILVLLTCIISAIIFLNKLGKGFFMRELIYLHAVFTCLFMPLLGYLYYNTQNPLALLWFRYMPVEQGTYFSTVLPAVLLFGIGLLMPSRNYNFDDTAFVKDRIAAIKKGLQAVPSLFVMVLFGISMIAYFTRSFLPEALQQVIYYLFLAFFTAVLYVMYHEKIKTKWIFFGLAVVFVVWDTLRGGMFTFPVYMGALVLMFLIGDKPVKLHIKVILISLSLSAIIFMQFFKLSYRNEVWRGTTEAASADAVDKALAGSIKAMGNDDLVDAAFPLYYRMNQGYNVGLTIKHIPAVKPFADGEELFIVFSSAFVPRLFWPDKPRAGGHYNMERYAGYIIKGFSTNVGPIGEAYGNFGKIGGAIYMFFFGLFLRWAYFVVLKRSFKLPLLLLWIPVLFFQITYVMETDSLQAFNFFLKGIVFVWIMYRLFPRLFGVVH